MGPCASRALNRPPGYRRGADIRTRTLRDPPFGTPPATTRMHLAQRRRTFVVDALSSRWRSRAPIGGEAGPRERVRGRARAAGSVLLGAVVLLATPGVAGAKAQAAGDYIVLYERSVASVTRETDGLERTEGFRSKRRYAHAVKGFAARLSARQVSALKDDPQVASVTQDRQVHAFDSVPLVDGEVPPLGIRRIEASTATTTREASSAAVAVIDTGIDLRNPDLNAATGKDCV